MLHADPKCHKLCTRIAELGPSTGTQKRSEHAQCNSVKRESRVHYISTYHYGACISSNNITTLGVSKGQTQITNRPTALTYPSTKAREASE